jgi:integrating conjugative element protein (TIGR03749 family)
VSSKKHFFVIALSLFSHQLQADNAVERLFWDKVPLKITLLVGTERLVTFPAEVRVGVPWQLTDLLRTQSNQGTVYWLAKEPFEAQRIEVREIQSKRIYLIDLKASKKSGLSATPIEVIRKKTGQKPGNPRNTPRQKRRAPGFVELTRFAAQQLYAPARLLKAAPGIHRVSVSRQALTHLIRGDLIKAIPLVSWKSGQLYVTAVELVNTSQKTITLDPRNIRGEWRTATFQHTILYPKGSEADTTALYLISDRPFQEAI